MGARAIRLVGPRTIRWTVLESNFCTSGSYVAATLHPREGGGTRVHVEWERTGTTPKGRLAVNIIKLTRGRPIAASLKKAFDRLERRPAQAAGSGRSS